MNLKNLIEQWESNSEKLTCSFQFEKVEQEIKEQIKKELSNENEINIYKHICINEYAAA